MPPWYRGTAARPATRMACGSLSRLTRVTASPARRRRGARRDDPGCTRRPNCWLLERLIERDDVMLQAEDRGLGPVGETELGQDAGDVALDRLLADRQRAADLPVGPAAGHLAQHVEFPRGQQAERIVLLASLQFLDQPRGGRGLQHALTPGRSPHRLDRSEEHTS